MTTTAAKSFRARWFDWAVSLKGLDGLFEILGSLLLYFSTPESLGHLVQWLTQHELSEDPHDLIATGLLKLFGQLTVHTQALAAAYLASHGLVKIFLVWGLLHRRSWSFPVALFFLGAFIVYQAYRLSFNHSLPLAMLTLFDFLVFFLVWREYQHFKSVAR